MMPNMNPKKMQKMMRQMGMNMEDIPADEVVIKKTDGDIVIKNPQVVLMKVQGKESFQITGDVQGADSGEVTIEVSDEDVEMVVSQAGVSEDAARKALEEASGDIAKAILELEKE